jgi:DNA modification methylase
MSVRVMLGDVREQLRLLPDASVHCVVTSPPYFGLRDYGMAGQIGLEQTPGAFVEVMIDVFREVRRVLRDDGTLWLNLGDSYANDGKWGGSTGGKHASALHGDSGIGRRKLSTGLKPKDLIGIPWRVAFALQADGWYLRQDIIWSKPNPMPESVTDRCTKAHEYLFLLSKSARYHYDADAIKEAAIHEGRVVKASGSEAKNGQKGDFGATAAGFTMHDTLVTDRNRRSVWTVSTQPFSEAHFATFPPALIEPCIKAGCIAGGTVLDPFGGAGTTGLVADRLQRNAILVELNPEYAAMARRRIDGDAPLFANAVEGLRFSPEMLEAK